jgi:xanthine dehydrogenase accessory factor
VLAPGADAARFPDAERVLTGEESSADVAPGSFVVVATQGRRDLQGLRAALALDARRVFFVASARKAAVLKAALVEAGCDAAAVDAIVAPAGPAIGAQTPEEIALSVLAAVVTARRGGGAAQVRRSAADVSPAAAGRSPPLPLPEVPAVAGACCGGGAAAPAATATPPAPPRPLSCCSG